MSRRPPNATSRRRPEAATPPVKAVDSAPYVAFVWKTIADPFAGRITMLRVVAGTLKADTNVHNVTRDGSGRLGHLLLLQGKTQTHVTEMQGR